MIVLDDTAMLDVVLFVLLLVVFVCLLFSFVVLFSLLIDADVFL